MRPESDKGSRKTLLAAGVGMVHQELAFCENMSVAENLCLGRLPAFGGFLDRRAMRRRAEEMLAAALTEMPKELRRRVLLAGLGFPFYDVATLPLLRNENLTEFDPVKVDRISPDDARSIRAGGTRATLRGTEFYNFGAFFSRAYRENDYLWGRLHGAERMIDLVASTVEGFAEGEMAAFKRRAFLAILDEEKTRCTADPGLVEGIRCEVERPA